MRTQFKDESMLWVLLTTWGLLVVAFLLFFLLYKITDMFWSLI